MNNSDTALIVISFNEGHQSLLERHVPLGWGGGRGKWRGQWGIFKRRNLLWDIKITRGGSPEPIETLFTFWRVISSVAMKKNVKATERKGSAVCCILLWLNLGARGEHLTSQLSWIAAWRLIQCVWPVYLVDELVVALLRKEEVLQYVIYCFG